MNQEHDWHIQIEYMKAQLRYVLENLDSIGKRREVKDKIENVYSYLDDLCEQTKN